MKTVRGLSLLLLAAVILAIAAACGGGDKGSGFDQPGNDGGATDDGSSGTLNNNVGAHLMSITVDPPQAAIESVNGAPVTQGFKAVGHFDDGSSAPLNDATWLASAPQVGAIDPKGLYTASGSIGGVVTVTATAKGQTGHATLTVKLHLVQNTPNLPPNVSGALDGATNKDANVVWAYPYDGTVWPRGLLPPTLMWNGGAATDDYLVHLVNPTFELQAYTTAQNAPTSRLPLDPTTWQQFVDSSTGATQLTVARWDGTAATVIAKHGWTVAGASMRGTIYYWSNNLGRVLRIKPGAAKPDDFANQAPLNDPNQFVQSSCLMTCHTVSADGSTLVSGGGTYGGSYDLKAGKPTFSLGGTWGNPNGTNSSSVVRWSNATLSPTGKYIVTNAMAQGLSLDNDKTSDFVGLFTTVDGKPVATSGLVGKAMTQPAWSPDGTRIAFVDNGDATSWGSPPGIPWNNPPPGDLKVYQFDETKNPMVTGPTTLVASGADPNKRIAWPTMSPDGNWIVYSRAVGADTRSGLSDLFIASATTANQETRLARVDGDGYPFAAGDRDRAYNYEPSFAPVAAGGYFWVVFTSRRTYGNILTGGPQSDPNTGFLGTKQLWVVAIDQNPAPGTDPSHPPFHLTGQDEQNLAMRGFWALDPCKGDGQGCQSGTECCGGYCDGSGGPDAGGPICKSTASCGQNGDKCEQTSDCCNAAAGVTCINHVCSEPTPK
jgi:hypothetical protein